MNRFQVVAVAVCLILNMLDGFDVLAVAFTAPSIADEWSLSPETLGYLISSGLMGMLAGSILLAPLADIIGRRSHILLCLVIVTVGMVMAGLAKGVLEMAAWRVATGIGIGGMIASLTTVVAEYSNDKRRGLAISIMAIGYPVGTTLGGLMSIYLIQNFGWRSVFIFGAIATFTMIPIVLAALPESLDFLLFRRPRRALERVNRLLGLLGLAPLTSLPEPAHDQQQAVSIVNVFGPRYLVPSLQMGATYFLVIFTFYFLIAWTPKILVNLGLSLDIGISGTVLMSFGGILGGLSFGALTGKFRLRTLSSLFMALCFVFTVIFGFLPAQPLAMMAIAFIIGFFIFGGVISLYAIIPNLYPARIRNTGTGFGIGMGRVGAAVGPIVTGYLIGEEMPREVYYTLMALPLIGAIFFVRSIAAIKRNGAPG